MSTGCLHVFWILSDEEEAMIRQAIFSEQWRRRRCRVLSETYEGRSDMTKHKSRWLAGSAAVMLLTYLAVPIPEQTTASAHWQMPR